jgi:hypothetical protein
VCRVAHAEAHPHARAYGDIRDWATRHITYLVVLCLEHLRNGPVM